ncbi:MAG: hypothetical protein PWR32_748, partial [Candidatus Woesearchaeota archaeon]|nr:hypothetical protein [Candidatus Woesearchaeota archaeon]
MVSKTDSTFSSNNRQVFFLIAILVLVLVVVYVEDVIVVAGGDCGADLGPIALDPGNCDGGGADEPTPPPCSSCKYITKCSWNTLEVTAINDCCGFDEYRIDCTETLYECEGGTLIVNSDGFCSVLGEDHCEYRSQIKKNCLTLDGWYCNGNTREYRDYYDCGYNGDLGHRDCLYKVTKTENCDSKDSYYCEGHYKVFRDYTCLDGNCVYTHKKEDCSDLNKWVAGGDSGGCSQIDDPEAQKMSYTCAENLAIDPTPVSYTAKNGDEVIFKHGSNGCPSSCPSGYIDLGCQLADVDFLGDNDYVRACVKSSFDGYCVRSYQNNIYNDPECCLKAYFHASTATCTSNDMKCPSGYPYKICKMVENDGLDDPWATVCLSKPSEGFCYDLKNNENAQTCKVEDVKIVTKKCSDYECRYENPPSCPAGYAELYSDMDYYFVGYYDVSDDHYPDVYWYYLKTCVKTSGCCVNGIVDFDRLRRCKSYYTCPAGYNDYKACKFVSDIDPNLNEDDLSVYVCLDLADRNSCDDSDTACTASGSFVNCGSDEVCVSGECVKQDERFYCKGSVTDTFDCDVYDGWYGGGNLEGIGDDPKSVKLDFYASPEQDPCAGVTCGPCEHCVQGLCAWSCAPGEVCANGKCISGDDVSPSLPTEPRPTPIDSPSLESTSNQQITGLAVGLTGCSSDFDCGDCEYCDNGECVSSCSAGQVCYNGA